MARIAPRLSPARELDSQEPLRDIDGAMRGSRFATVIILVLWVLLGPVGMALSGCMMMDGCDALCSVPSLAPMVATALSTQTASALAPSDVTVLPQNVWSVPDSPPKPAPALL